MNIDYPFHFDSRGRTAATDDDDHIRDMIEELLFGPNSPELAAALQFTLQATLQRWLGDLIELQALEVTSEDSTLSILIQYVVRRNNQRQVAQFTRTV